MKALLLASTIAAWAGIGSAFASVTVYTDGSMYDSSPAAAAAQCNMPTKGLTGAYPSSSDPARWQRSDAEKVVRSGPPESGLGEP
jgi:hypothetical protein